MRLKLISRLKLFFTFFVGVFILFASHISNNCMAAPQSSVSLPKQLFDIQLILDQSIVSDIGKLTTRVMFINFGTETTSVEMTFTIVDAIGKEYYRSVDGTSIQTEGVYNKKFDNLMLPNGKYQVVLNTLYNSNVRDEFKQPFEILAASTTSWQQKLLGNKLIISIVLGLLLFVFHLAILHRRKKNNNEQQ